jgi:hypothetical protein
MIKVNFTRKFYKGNLNGLTHNDSITFINREAALRWLAGIKQNVEKLDYYIENYEIA